ncbi:MAG TPA: 2-isopropylmalate synthase [Alphaproteobacteria bacterium]|nr:2-isopropylmalate synthase [Alphaproteobacteria bacterium]
MTSSTKNRVLIFDTTMRDGEQSPGASMTLDEKLRIAEMLETMGVDIIEAGFPIASNGDFEAVREVSKIVKNSVVAGLSRANIKDIDRAWEALKGAKRPRIHSVIATSPVHMKYKLQMEPDQVLDTIIGTVTHARNLCGDVEWSAEDATRAEFDFLCRCIDAAIRSGATTINLPDTVGYAMPVEYGKLIAGLIANVANSDKAVFSTHCHNDLGLAVANSLAAVANGARQVECTINGLGERAGNAALEEIVMALRVRNDFLPYETGVISEKFVNASRMISTVTGFPVQYNKAIVGKNAFSHESGIHQDGMLKNTQTYEIMTPESVGVVQSSLVMGKHSGRHAFRKKIEEMGYQLGQNAIEDAFVRFKELTDRKKQVYDEDIAALIDDTLVRGQDKIKLVSLQVVCGTRGPQTATLELDVDGDVLSTTATGNGPVDAIFNAIHALYPHEAKLQLYQVHAVTEGTDAQAEVSVRLEQNGKAVTGQGADSDTLVASAGAYVNALNRLLVKHDKILSAAHTASV